MAKKKTKELEMYCPKCGHCGFIECCGITDFLRKHVVGKTGCLNEADVLRDIITLINQSLMDTMKQDYLNKCGRCKSYKCSGWHVVYSKKTKNGKLLKEIIEKQNV